MASQKMSQFHMMRNHGPNIRHQIQHNMQQRLNQNQLQQNPFQHPQQHQFTKQAVDVAKDTEKLQNDQQRLASLHSKLHKEAEKIRHWKTEKETEIKQKEKSLSDSIQTIESLRKSIIELQFQNEEFSTKLHDKEIEKEETEQKMNTVKEMANVLREQMVQLETRILKGEQDKAGITQVHQNIMEENRALVLKFQELDINQAALIENHSKQTQALEDKYSNEVKDLQSNIRHLENQLIILMDTKTTQGKSISEYESKLKNNEESLAKLQKEFAINTEKLKHAEQVMYSQEQTLVKSKSTVQDLTVQLEEYNKKLTDTTNNLLIAQEERDNHQHHAIEVKEICSNEINSLQSDLKELSSVIQEKDLQFENLKQENENKNTLITDLKKACHDKTNTNETLKSKLEEVKKSLQEFEEKHQDLSNKIIEGTDRLAAADTRVSEITKTNADLQKRNQLLDDSIIRLEEQKSELENQLIKEQSRSNLLEEKVLDQQKGMLDYSNQIKGYEEQVNTVDKQLGEFRGEKVDLESKLKTISTNHESALKEIDELKQTVSEKEQEITSHQDTFELSVKETNELKEKIAAQDIVLAELMQKRQENEANMKTVLAGQEKIADSLGHKTKSLQNQINIKTKQVKNLEKENKTLKNQLKKASDKLLKIEEEAKQRLEEVNLKKEQMNALEEELKASKQEQQTSKERFDSEQKEFCVILEQYKLENDKIVADYINEKKVIEEQLVESKKSYYESQEQLKKELAETKQTIESQKQTISNLAARSTTYEANDEKIVELEELITLREQEMSAMQIKNREIESTNQNLVEKLHELKDRKHEVQTEEQQDRMVPTTPNSATNLVPVTPQSILHKSKSSREKRVLFKGQHDDEEMDEAPIKFEVKTPTIGTKKPKISNIRFSPKPSPHLFKEAEEDERKALSTGPQKKPVNRSIRKLTDWKKHKQFTDDLVMASPTVQRNIYDSPKNLLTKPKKGLSKVGLPSEVSQSSVLKNKMKKIKPSISKKKEVNLSWFDTDVFAFDE